MNDKIKISVIMPSVNVGGYIEECILSVINQTLKDIEIICVDANSTDGTLDILKKYAQKDSRINVITSNKMLPTLTEKVYSVNGEHVQIYKKNNDDFNRQTSISQNVQNIIDNNPIPFVKIKKKIKS